MSSKFLLNIDSFKPEGMIGWPKCAVNLCKNYNCDIAYHESSDEDLDKIKFIKDSLDLDVKFVSVNADSDLNEYNTYVSLSIIDNEYDYLKKFKGTKVAALGGPYSFDWNKQLSYYRDLEIDIIISELLHDEINLRIGDKEYAYCNKRLKYLPPLNDNLYISTASEKKLIIVDHEENFASYNNIFSTEVNLKYADLARLLIAFKRLNEIDVIDIRDIHYEYNTTDLSTPNHVFSFLKYPQLNLLLFLKSLKEGFSYKAIDNQDSLLRFQYFGIYNEYKKCNIRINNKAQSIKKSMCSNNRQPEHQ